MTDMLRTCWSFCTVGGPFSLIVDVMQQRGRMGLTREEEMERYLRAMIGPFRLIGHCHGIAKLS